MKVFNWVHPRFLNVNPCTAFLEENGTQKDESSKIENEMNVFHGHNSHMIVDMLDSWKDGILSIGTIAISPLEASKYAMLEEIHDDNHDYDDDHHVIDDRYDLDENDDQSSPLMNVEYFSHELDKVIGANHEIIEEEQVYENNNCIEDEEQSRRRVTLAELFLEDSDYHHNVKVLQDDDDDDDDDGVKGDIMMNEKQGIDMMIMKPNSLAKNGLFKAKKLLKEDLHPLKKFNQLMKRMMKKKIHPDDLEGKLHKDMQIHPSSPTNGQDLSNDELASLLLIQAAMV
ncbi:protein TILLER ANGLE CONTROL 1-like isoform X2 [Amaranthus tricolor]|uniref:protein TILLER ANGLE CONTROL 1-like isoform X2 n=1 Tax=Amaranthus tricolor TaxID=29722 RepID=UPI0025870144|nr:protein TILLER ANGLE CONTROL 1-like isoform X2 [Amaranthus tricolor]